MLATALAPSAAALIGLRAVQGLTSATVITTSTAIVTFAYPQDERGKALGVFAAGPYLGMTLGPVLGGVIVHHGGWRFLFLATGALGVANCLFPLWTPAQVEWRVPRPAPFDWIGTVLYAASLPAVLLGLTLLPGLGAIALVAAGVVALITFLRWETRAPDPLFDVGLFRQNHVLGSSNMAAFINYAATAAVTFLMSLYLQYTRGLDPQKAGVVLVAGVFMQAAFSPLAGRVADRIDARVVASTGMALCFLGLLGLAFVSQSTSYAYIVLMTCVLGLGFAFFASPITHVVMGSVQSPQVGMASSTLASVRWAGNNVSIALAGLVLTAVVGAETIEPSAYPRLLTAIRLNLYIFSGLCLVGLTALVLGTKRQGG
jgi:MFS family permease